jgi:Zn-dependent protease with chaperone function
MRTLQVETAERRRRHRVVEWSIAGVAALMLIGVVGIPALAELLVPFIPYTADMAMGASADQAEKGDFKEPGPVLCGDEGNQERAGKAVFLRLVSRMESAANLPIPLHVSVVRTRVINASAGGGYVTVNMGLINDARTPDELGATIGHELGHVAHRDMLRNFLHQAGLSFLFGAVLGDVTGSSGITYAAFKVLGNRNSRGVEAQADAYGADLMRKLGANAHADADFFERMMKNARPSRRMLLFLDHPADADRIAAIRREPNSANPKPLLSDEEWQTLKQVCSRK